jgi:MGT family glycosyltransferase
VSKILFASMPFDGHFNPLTGLAVHLRERGHDVRWYAGPSYATRLAAIDVPRLPFHRATEVTAENLVEIFPEYEKLGTGPKAIAFALRELFFGNLEAHYRDIVELREEFVFDALICDTAFYAGCLVAETLEPRVYTVAAAPTPAPTSKQTPPPFFGLAPARSLLGRIRDRILSALVKSSTKSGMKVLHDLRAREGLPRYGGSVFDLHVGTARRMFQIGAPGLDYPRTDWPKQFEFIGALLPHRKPGAVAALPCEDALARFRSVVVVSQGTVDNRDPDKLFVPSLEALAGSEHLVVVTTGGRHTSELRRRFPQDNVVVEDWIDFHALLPRADLFICNGGFGSVLLALSNGVPVLSAGKLEGKNDVNARLAYAGVGLDLGSERPSAATIARGVKRVLGDPRYAANVGRVRAELESYRPFEIIERALAEDGIIAAPVAGDLSTPDQRRRSSPGA